MFGLSIKFLGAAAVAVCLAGSGGYVWGRLDGAALTEAAVERALTKAREDTDNAINQLANVAERSRAERIICERGRGGVWSFELNDCIQTKADP